MLNHVIGPKQPKRADRGEPAPGRAVRVRASRSSRRTDFRFGVSFYLIAMLFILFDIEVVFLYPVGVILKGADSVFVLGELVTFVVLLLRRLRLRLAQGSPGLEVERRDDCDAQRQLRARDMLRGDLEGEDLERYVEERVVTTTFEKLLNWARANSIFPLTFGLACCAIEAPISIVTARYDLARFGAEALRASPRQADLIILSGRVSIKMAPVVRRLYDQMLEPKWAISMGACSSSRRHVLQLRRRPGRRQVHADRPPHPRLPAAAGGGPLRLHQAAAQDQGNPDQGWRARYNAVGTEEWARGGPRSEAERRGGRGLRGRAGS